MTCAVAHYFASHAEMIGLCIAGLQGITIYRDSQFELAAREFEMSDAERIVARAAFNHAIDDRVVREFPKHIAARDARQRLHHALKAAA